MLTWSSVEPLDKAPIQQLPKYIETCQWHKHEPGLVHVEAGGADTEPRGI